MAKTLLTERARRLRRDDTRPEAALWDALRARRLGGLKWKRQVPRGPFIVDFLCLEAALVVEVDGDSHYDAVAYDRARTARLEAQGLRVLRFTNAEVLHHLPHVCEEILRQCNAAFLSPPLGRG